jgi:hypothetical protein
MQTLDRIMVGVPPEEIEQICFGNATELYRIDRSRL